MTPHGLANRTSKPYLAILHVSKLDQLKWTSGELNSVTVFARDSARPTGWPDVRTRYSRQLKGADTSGSRTHKHQPLMLAALPFAYRAVSSEVVEQFPKRREQFWLVGATIFLPMKLNRGHESA